VWYSRLDFTESGRRVAPVRVCKVLHGNLYCSSGTYWEALRVTSVWSANQLRCLRYSGLGSEGSSVSQETAVPGNYRKPSSA
jgi:hypothetical protein